MPSFLRKILKRIGFEFDFDASVLYFHISNTNDKTYLEVEDYFSKFGGIHAASFNEPSQEIGMGYSAEIISKEKISALVNEFAEKYGYQVLGMRRAGKE